MVTIDIEKAKAIIEEFKNRPKPKLVIVVSQTVDSPQSTVESLQSIVDSEQPIDHRPLTMDQPTTANEKTPDLVAQCRDEYNQLRIEQGKVSNTIAAAVAGGAGLAELKDLYAEIESYRPDLIKLHQRYKHVQQYGTLPVQQVVNEVSVDIFKLKDSRKKLVDERCKLGIKIKGGHIKEQKVLDWQLRLDEVNAEYDMLDTQIKNLEGK